MNGSLLAANPLQRTEEPEEEPRPGLSLVCTRSRGRAWPHWGCGQSVGHASGLGLPGCCQVTTKVNSLQTKSFPGPHGGQSGPQARGKHQLYAGHTGSQGRVAGRLHSDGGLERLAQSPRDVWPRALGRGSGGASGSGLATRCRCLSCLSRPSSWASGKAGCPQ